MGPCIRCHAGEAAVAHGGFWCSGRCRRGPAPKCLHPACDRPAHVEERFAGYCCRQCERFAEARAAKNHGKLCAWGPAGIGAGAASPSGEPPALWKKETAEAATPVLPPPLAQTLATEPQAVAEPGTCGSRTTLFGLPVRPAPTGRPGGVASLGESPRRGAAPQCLRPACDRPAHAEERFAGYCCKQCERFAEAGSAENYGKLCAWTVAKVWGSRTTLSGLPARPAPTGRPGRVPGPGESPATTADRERRARSLGRRSLEAASASSLARAPGRPPLEAGCSEPPAGTKLERLRASKAGALEFTGTFWKGLRKSKEKGGLTTLSPSSEAYVPSSDVGGSDALSKPLEDFLADREKVYSLKSLAEDMKRPTAQRRAATLAQAAASSYLRLRKRPVPPGHELPLHRVAKRPRVKLMPCRRKAWSTQDDPDHTPKKKTACTAIAEKASAALAPTEMGARIQRRRFQPKPIKQPAAKRALVEQAPPARRIKGQADRENPAAVEPERAEAATPLSGEIGRAHV